MSRSNTLLSQQNNLNIADDTVVRLDYRVSDATAGDLLQAGVDLVYLHGGYGGAFPKVEQALEGCRAGESVTVELAPGEGYGTRDPELVLTLPPDTFGDESPCLGDTVEGQFPSGSCGIFTVIEICDTHIRVDGNHPFAGRNLRMELTALEVREASDAEIAAGYPFDGLAD